MADDAPTDGGSDLSGDDGGMSSSEMIAFVAIEDVDRQQIATNDEAMIAFAAMSQSEMIEFVQDILDCGDYNSATMRNRIAAIAQRGEGGEAGCQAAVGQHVALTPAEVQAHQQEALEAAAAHLPGALEAIHIVVEALGVGPFMMRLHHSLNDAAVSLEEVTIPLARGAAVAGTLIQQVADSLAVAIQEARFGFSTDEETAQLFHLVEVNKKALHKARDTCVRQIRGFAEPGNRAHFLLLAAEAHRRTLGANDTIRAQLLLAYHKDISNTNAFVSSNAIATKNRGGKPRKRRKNKARPGATAPIADPNDPSCAAAQEPEPMHIGPDGWSDQCGPAALNPDWDPPVHAERRAAGHSQALTAMHAEQYSLDNYWCNYNNYWYHYPTCAVPAVAYPVAPMQPWDTQQHQPYNYTGATSPTCAAPAVALAGPWHTRHVLHTHNFGSPPCLITPGPPAASSAASSAASCGAAPSSAAPFRPPPGLINTPPTASSAASTTENAVAAAVIPRLM